MTTHLGRRAVVAPTARARALIRSGVTARARALIRSGVTAACLTCLGAPRVGVAAAPDWATGMRAELTGGLAPRSFGADQSPEPAVAFELLPTAGLRLSGHTYTLTTRFQQRWYMRQPNLMDYDRPLLLNRLFGNYERQLTSRLAWSVAASAVGGAMDFLAAPTMLQQPAPSGSTTGSPLARTSTLPNTAVVQLLTLYASTRLGYQLSPREDLDGSIAATRQTPIGTENSTLRRTQQISFSSGYGYQWSTSTQLRSQATVAAIQATTSNYQSIAVSQGIMHAWSARTTSTALLGVTAFNAPGRTATSGDREADATARELRFFPNAALAVTHLQGPEARRLTLTAGATLAGFFDPMTSNLRTTLGLSLGALRVLDRNWTANARADAMLPTSTRPLTLVGAGRAGETYVSTSLGFARRLGMRSRLETGVRYSFFGTHPRDFTLLTQQAWIYAGFSIWEGTDAASHGAWVL